MSVGLLSDADSRRRVQSNSPMRRSRLVVEVRSVRSSSSIGILDLAEISASESSLLIGPESPSLGLPTRIGYVRHTTMILRTRLGAIPASAKQPLTLVSRDVTCGYEPWCRE